MDMYNSKEVETRKNHDCLFCGGTIKKGMRAHYQSNKVDGEFYNYYLCLFCERADGLIDLDDGLFQPTELSDHIDLLCACGERLDEWGHHLSDNMDQGYFYSKCDDCGSTLTLTYKEMLEHLKSNG